MSKPKASKRTKAIVWSVVGVALIGGLLYGRKEANGLRNLFSYNYWWNRATGIETYKADVKYFMRGSRSHKDVCFTFDDGPHTAGAPLILKALKDAGVHATFFVVGIRVKEHPELVKQMIDEGNEVGNHTQDHYRLDTLPLKQVKAEIDNCNINIERACGRTTTLIRPPGERFNHQILKLISDMGYTTIGWNVGARDFIVKASPNETPDEILASQTTPQQVVQRVMKDVKPGVIILLHDNPVTAQALPELLKQLKDQGYEIKTITQMLAELNPSVRIIANPPADPRDLRWRKAAAKPAATKP